MNYQNITTEPDERRTRHAPLVFCAALSLAAGCARPVAPRPPAPAAPRPAAPSASAPAPVVLTSYPAYQPLPPGAQTKSLTLAGITPGDNSVPAGGGPPPPNAPAPVAKTPVPVAQGGVSLDDYQFHITPDGAGGSVLDGTVSVHNHGPYDIVGFQVSLRQGGRLYVLMPPGGGRAIPPSQATVYRVHAAVPPSPDQLKTGKSFLLEAQLDGPPLLATDEESGTTLFSTTPGPPRP